MLTLLSYVIVCLLRITALVAITLNIFIGLYLYFPEHFDVEVPIYHLVRKKYLIYGLVFILIVIDNKGFNWELPLEISLIGIIMILSDMPTRLHIAIVNYLHGSEQNLDFLQKKTKKKNTKSIYSKHWRRISFQILALHREMYFIYYSGDSCIPCDSKNHTLHCTHYALDAGWINSIGTYQKAFSHIM